MLKQPLNGLASRGFSLVEMMVAIVAGLIVVGAALAFTVATVRAYGENIRSTKLSHELRTGMNFVVREIRRAGYDGAYSRRVLTDLSTTQFRNVSSPASGCLIFQYDRGGSLGDAPVAGEKRAIRHVAGRGALELLTENAGTNCGSSTGTAWKPLTDPTVMTVTAFAPTVYESPFCAVDPGQDTNGDGVKDKFGVTLGSVTSITLCLKGSLVAEPGIVRQLTDTVRIRADKLSYPSATSGYYPTQADADAACAAIAAPANPPTPSELNASCAAL